MEDSIFTKIIKGDIPAHKIYEDDRTVAFLDIHPSNPGHTLVIPKAQVDQLWDLSEEDYMAVQLTAKKVARRLREVLSPARVGVHVMGFDVPHAHVHVFPMNTPEDFWRRADMGAEPDHMALAVMAEKLTF